MKFLKIWAAVALLLVACAVSYQLGTQKHYESACRMADLIRCYSDHLHEDSLIEDYGCFDELLDVFLYDDGIGDSIKLEEYSWCY